MSPTYYQRGPSRSPFPPISPFDRLSRMLDGLPPVTAWLLKANVVLFLLFWLGGLFGSSFLAQLYTGFALSRLGLAHHYYWQPLTYMFLHGGFMHILLNMLTLVFLGPETERSMGSRHFLAMYLLSGVLGGLGWAWLAPANQSGIICVGASGAIFGVMGAFATLFPGRRLTVFIFLFPVTTEAWKMMLGLAILEFLMIPTGGGVANAAHFFGALAGFLYIDRLYESAFCRKALAWVRDYFRQRPHTPYQSPSERSAPPPDQAEVDRILDKITREGIQSLTREERQTLHRASSSF
ncbi:MAG: rhomboid family intramembrane serine protease [Kiritimatiellae bacterium]|nr:rhomboid family intramembrane serine protease [Kiritimatiellia bacterium]